MTSKRLERSNDRMLGGVCGGLGEWLGWNPVAIRALFVLLFILTFGFAVFAYVLLWWMMPPPGASTAFRLDDFRQQ
ncbi:MAG: PspC domain-containing protein [Gemmatimonadaceae bacterium]